jgi:hypothetical protein
MYLLLFRENSRLFRDQYNMYYNHMHQIFSKFTSINMKDLKGIELLEAPV